MDESTQLGIAMSLSEQTTTAARAKLSTGRSRTGKRLSKKERAARKPIQQLMLAATDVTNQMQRRGVMFRMKKVLLRLNNHVYAQPPSSSTAAAGHSLDAAPTSLWELHKGTFPSNSPHYLTPSMRVVCQRYQETLTSSGHNPPNGSVVAGGRAHLHISEGSSSRTATINPTDNANAATAASGHAGAATGATRHRSNANGKAPMSTSPNGAPSRAATHTRTRTCTQGEGPAHPSADHSDDAEHLPTQYSQLTQSPSAYLKTMAARHSGSSSGSMQPRPARPQLLGSTDVLVEQLGALVDCSTGSDVQFLVDCGSRVIHGHRAILQARCDRFSEVGQALRHSPAADTPNHTAATRCTTINSSTPYVVELDVGANTVLEVLRYIYTGSCRVSPPAPSLVAVGARLFGLPELEEIAANFNVSLDQEQDSDGGGAAPIP